jgi:hypothetical protein
MTLRLHASCNPCIAFAPTFREYSMIAKSSSAPMMLSKGLMPARWHRAISQVILQVIILDYKAVGGTGFHARFKSA